MAKQSVDSLTITIAGKGGDDILISSLVRVLSESYKILHELDNTRNLKWKVRSIHASSPVECVLAAEPRHEDRSYSTDISKRYLDMFRKLEAGGGLPPRVEVATARRAKRLVDVLNNGVASIQFQSPLDKEPFNPSQRVQASVSEMESLPSDPYRAFAVIEGLLDTVSVRGGTDRFILYDRITGYETECIVTDEKQLAKAAEVIKSHNTRVSVHGIVQYEDDLPKQIQVSSFNSFPTDDQLPSEDDLRGFDITGGEDSVDYIRKMRDAQ